MRIKLSHAITLLLSTGLIAQQGLAEEKSQTKNEVKATSSTTATQPLKTTPAQELAQAQAQILRLRAQNLKQHELINSLKAQIANKNINANAEDLADKAKAEAEAKKKEVCKKEKEKSPWGGNAQLGLVKNTGNSRNTTYTGAFGLTYTGEKWTTGGSVSSQYSKSKEETTANRKTADLNTRYNFSDRQYLFGNASYVDDEFASYNIVVTDAIGYGASVVKTPTQSLDLQVGPGSRHSKLAGTGEWETEFVLSPSIIYTWNITDSTKFKENLSSNIGNKLTYTESTTSLEMTVIGNLGMQLSYNIRNNSNTRGSKNKHRTDATSNVSLIYNF